MVSELQGWIKAWSQVGLRVGTLIMMLADSPCLTLSISLLELYDSCSRHPYHLDSKDLNKLDLAYFTGSSGPGLMWQVTKPLTLNKKGEVQVGPNNIAFQHLLHPSSLVYLPLPYLSFPPFSVCFPIHPLRYPTGSPTQPQMKLTLLPDFSANALHLAAWHSGRNLRVISMRRK